MHLKQNIENTYLLAHTPDKKEIEFIFKHIPWALYLCWSNIVLSKEAYYLGLCYKVL